jgi:hypothetical protein
MSMKTAYGVWVFMPRRAVGVGKRDYGGGQFALVGADAAGV